MNCTGTFNSEVFNNSSLLDPDPETGNDNNPNPNQPEVTTPAPLRGKDRMGVIMGVALNQQFVNQMPDFGGWYYRYTPHPNSIIDSGETINTVTWANQYNKEFVPMIHNLNYNLGPGKGSCGLISGLNNNECSVEQLVNNINEIKALFQSSNQPQYLITFNEPYKNTAQVGGPSIAVITPEEAIKAWGKINELAKQTQLKIVSPSTSVETAALKWTSEFLKLCHDRPLTCDLNLIEAFNVHGYECTSKYWQDTYIKKGFQKSLISLMKNYGGRNWQDYIMGRKIWVTETTCNWDLDFVSEKNQNRFVRSNTESCLRATGQREGFGEGSLKTIYEASDNDIARFAWWTNYLDPFKNSDVSEITDSSQNRIAASRLFDDFYELTPIGRAYFDIIENGKNPKSIDCHKINRYLTYYWQCGYTLRGKNGGTWKTIRKVLFDDECERSTYAVKQNNPNATIIAGPEKIFVGMDNGLSGPHNASAHTQESILQCRYILNGTRQVYRNTDINDECSTATQKIKQSNPNARITSGPTLVWISKDDGLINPNSPSHLRGETIECHFELKGKNGNTWSSVRITDQLNSNCTAALNRVKANNPNATITGPLVIYSGLDQ